MEQTFQPLPPEQIPPSPPTLPPKSLRERLQEHKMGVIIGCVACFLVIGMIAYLISPAGNTLVAPANEERMDFLQVQSPTPQSTFPTAPNIATPTSLPTSIPATSWQTYTNTTYAYSIKYPSDWTVQNLGVLEPQIPSYITFNPTNASQSSRFITISVSTRSYQEQLALGSSSSAIAVAGITGTKQFFQDSQGNQSMAVILPRASSLLILWTKIEFSPILTDMLSTLTFRN